MSKARDEINRQLREAACELDRCRAEAGKLRNAIIAATSFSDDDELARLDDVAISRDVELLLLTRRRAAELVRERRTLTAQLTAG